MASEDGLGSSVNPVSTEIPAKELAEVPAGLPVEVPAGGLAEVIAFDEGAEEPVPDASRADGSEATCGYESSALAMTSAAPITCAGTAGSTHT